MDLPTYLSALSNQDQSRSCKNGPCGPSMEHHAELKPTQIMAPALLNGQIGVSKGIGIPLGSCK